VLVTHAKPLQQLLPGEQVWPAPPQADGWQVPVPVVVLMAQLRPEQQSPVAVQD
jgi:hypothetical protein